MTSSAAASQSHAASRSPGSERLVDRLTYPFRAWKAERDIRHQLTGAVERGLRAGVYGQLDGRPTDDEVLVLGSMRLDFPPHRHGDVTEYGRQFGGVVQQEVVCSIGSLRDELGLHADRSDHLSAELADRRDQRGSLDTSPTSAKPPPSNESVASRVRSQKRLAQIQQGFRQQQMKIVSFLSIVLAVAMAEGTLVFLSLAPAFLGAAGIAVWILPAQAALVTAALIYLAHVAKVKAEPWKRVPAGIVLVVICGSLALLRVGVISFKAGVVSTGGADASFQSWAIVFIMVIGGVCLALIGGNAFERVNEFSRKLSDLRLEHGDEIVKLQAELTTSRLVEANKIGFLRRQLNLARSLLPRLGKDINQLEDRLRSEHSEKRRTVLREITRARVRLAPEIRSAARQLGRWQQERPRKRHHGLLVLVPLLASLSGVSCAQPRPEVHVLIDSSASMTADVETRVKSNVTDHVQEWAMTAWADDEHSIWWFTQPDAPYPTAQASIKMPPIEVPAHVHRPTAMAQLEHEALLILEGLPMGVQHTPLLEAIFFIAATRNDPWSLVIYSDLIQDSAGWREARRIEPPGDQIAVIDAMRSICPPVSTPPSEIVVVSWPGITARQSDIHQHLDDRAAFSEFFNSWAPAANVAISFID